MIGASSLVPVPADEQAEAFATLVMAFAEDPVERFLYPAPADYLEHFPEFLAAFGGPAFTQQTAWWLGRSAVALWLPPGVEADAQAVVDVLNETVDGGRLREVLAVLDQMDEQHPTSEHWYLPWLGVDPVRRGTGLGGQLLDACLQIVDATHLPAYLETPNPRTIPFYTRHGFEVTGRAQAGACPAITCMSRPAR